MANPDADHRGDAGNEGMDGEHRVQIGLMAAFREAIGGGRGAEDAGEILDRLLDFSKVHFASEQLLMRLYEYDDYEVHLADHEDMLAEMEAVRESFRGGGSSIAPERVDALLEGLIAHIGRSDRALGRYLGDLERRPE